MFWLRTIDSRLHLGLAGETVEDYANYLSPPRPGGLWTIRCSVFTFRCSLRSTRLYPGSLQRTRRKTHEYNNRGPGSGPSDVPARPEISHHRLESPAVVI